MSKSIVILTAHPDDHVMFGGTILKFIKRGFKVHEILFTGGERARLLTTKTKNKKTISGIRIKELEKAHKILGIDTYTLLRLTDGNVIGSPEVIKKIVKVIRNLQPELVLMPHHEDYHPDHIAVSRIGFDAVKTANISTMPELGSSYRVPVVLMGEGLLPINPEIVIDITDEWEKRVEVESIYTSQFTPRMTQWRECFSGRNGYLLRSKYAEAFEIPKGWPADISKLF